MSGQSSEGSGDRQPACSAGARLEMASSTRTLSLSDGHQRRWLSRTEPGQGLALGSWLVVVRSPATASSSPGPAQPLPGESGVWASPRPARDLSQGPSAARKGAVCRPAPGALEEECGLINSPQLRGPRLEGAAARTGPPGCHWAGLSITQCWRDLRGTAHGELGDRGSGSWPLTSRHTRVLRPLHG